MITYQVAANGFAFELDAILDLYRDSTLGERRPIEDRARWDSVLRNSNLVVTAYDGDLLVGISRCVTDFAYATYLSDLAVRLSYQRQGIGKELIRRTQEACPQATVILLSAPKATEYYPHVGMKQHPSAWTLASADRLR
ncbi:MAG: GNAT family N-acetyltransferase [Bryobacterales bacterium]|nr:GNAT family N-acetyltransferase [Bryobacterales bacterium]